MDVLPDYVPASALPVPILETARTLRDMDLDHERMLTNKRAHIKRLRNAPRLTREQELAQLSSYSKPITLCPPRYAESVEPTTTPLAYQRRGGGTHAPSSTLRSANANSESGPFG